MKKNLAIIVLIIISVLSILYAYAQKIEAEKAGYLAVSQKKIAERQKAIADSTAVLARQQELIAEATVVMADECRIELKQCKEAK